MSESHLPSHTQAASEPAWSYGAYQSREDELAELVATAREGDGSAWRVLVERYSPLLRSIAGQTGLRDADAADAVQATWISCYASLHQLREPAALLGWLVITCRRESWAIGRNAARCSPASDIALTRAAATWGPQWGSASTDPVQAYLEKELDEVLHECIAALPDRKREIVRALLRSDAYDAVSAALGIPIGSIGPTRQRAIQDLRKRLQGRGAVAA